MCAFVSVCSLYLYYMSARVIEKACLYVCVSLCLCFTVEGGWDAGRRQINIRA